MASIFLEKNNSSLTISNNNVKAFGNTDTEVVKIAKGNTGIVLDSNVERIELSGVIADYKFKQLGNKLAIYDSNDVLVVKTGLQDDANGTQLTFGDGTTAAKLIPNTKGFSLSVDNQTISNIPLQIKTISEKQSVLEQSNNPTGNKTFLESNDTIFHVDNSAYVFRATGEQAVVIGANVKNVEMDYVERVQFSDSYKNYQFKQVGTDLKVYNLKNEWIASFWVQDDENGTQLTFAEGTVNARLVPSIYGLDVYVGGSGWNISGGVKVPVTTAEKLAIPEASFDTSLRSEPMIDIVGTEAISSVIH